jgi:hypothetical protein
VAHRSKVVVRGVCVAAMAIVLAAGLAACDPPQGTWVGTVTFLEKGSIPFNNGSRTANVRTTYEGAGNQVGGATTLVTAAVNVTETYPNPLNGQCFIKSVTYLGTITATTSSNPTLVGTNRLEFTGGSAEGAAGSVVMTTVQGGPGACKQTTKQYSGFFNETGPWTYNGLRGTFIDEGWNGTGTSSSARWLPPGYTSVAWQDLVIG